MSNKNFSSNLHVGHAQQPALLGIHLKKGALQMMGGGFLFIS